MGATLWPEYDAWNSAIATVFYPETDTPRPAYLDLDSDTLAGLAATVGRDEEGALEGLVDAVRATLRNDGGPAAVFASHMVRMHRWIRSGRQEIPPFLALLAVFSVAAEQMSAGDGMAANNYYGRLRSVLEWRSDSRHLNQAYRRVAERLWGELNRWLVEMDGQRGLPTAFALTHRHVGLSISQALVRSTDHERLKRFFRQYGFAPGTEVPPSSLTFPLGEWITSKPSPVSSGLQRLWARPKTRERITEAAAVSLANWDGNVDERNENSSPRPGTGQAMALTLEIGGFPRKQFALSALFYTSSADTPRIGHVMTARPPADVDLVPEIPGALGLGSGASLHAGDVLAGVLQVKDSLTGLMYERRPRRLVVFREEDLSRRWTEVPQVMLGDSVRLLAHRDLVARLDEVLAKIARPGWRTLETFPGQPEEWVLISDVEVLSSPGSLVKERALDDLSALVPLTNSQLKIAGGFALPGRIRGKWHVWAPPEVRAVSDAEEGFEVRVIDTGRFSDDDEPAERLLASWSDLGTGLVVQSFSELELADGDYRVELVLAESSSVLTSTHVLLRSSDSPDLKHWANLERVRYARGLGVLGVDPGERDIDAVQGHHAPAARGWVAPTTAAPGRLAWSTERSAARIVEPALRITVPDENSCIRTGRHVMLIDMAEPDSRGRPLSRWTTGKCQGCGLVKTYPTRLPKASFGSNSSATALPLPAVHDVTKVQPALAREERDFVTGFDALLHTGGGPWSHLERIALQVEPTQLFVDQLGRNLEVLGHIDIRRDARTLDAISFEVAPTSFVRTVRGYHFAGFWPNDLYARVFNYFEDAGIDVEMVSVEEAPPQYFLQAGPIDPRHSAFLAEAGVAVIEDAWTDLASFLPPLSVVLGDLPRSTVPLEGSVSRFRTGDASWEPVADAAAPGAYRVRRFTTADFVRTMEDVASGTAARSTVQLSKHLGASLEGRALMAFDKDSGVLFVPLGADLPGLYGRAVVAASGLPPTPDRQRRLLAYHDVPAELAGHLYDLLRS